MRKLDMIAALNTLGAYLHQHVKGIQNSIPKLKSLNHKHFQSFERIIKEEHFNNAWFTEAFIRKSIAEIVVTIQGNQPEKWLQAYPALPINGKSAKKIGVILAGNIPFVGFHDLISVILAGHCFLGKLSSKDSRLIPEMVKVLYSIEPKFSNRVVFTDGYLNNIDALIATGSDNTSRYFEYYFKNIPHIIRKNRNGIAILSGNETETELLRLGEDIFTYFGLGCRNVTKIFIPEYYKLETLLKPLEAFYILSQHHKYNNNLEYNRSVYLMNSIPFLDNGVLLLKEDAQFASPVGVVYYEKYSQLDSVLDTIMLQKDKIQCIVSVIKEVPDRISPGESQSPKLWEYADGIDTMKFLTEIADL